MGKNKNKNKNQNQNQKKASDVSAEFFIMDEKDAVEAKVIADAKPCADQLSTWVNDNMATFSDDAKALLTPTTLMRYAIAREGNFEAAKENLLRTIAWRVDHVPAVLGCPECQLKDQQSHCFFPIGLDRYKRVVIYACAAKAKMNEAEVTVQHMVHTLEHAWRATDELKLSHQWVWLVDFAGFGMWHAMQTRTSSKSLSTFSDHMPERMGKVVLLNPPKVFEILMSWVRTFVTARTLDKVAVVRCDASNVGAVLEPHGIPKDGPMARWLSECVPMAGTPGNVPSCKGLDIPLLKQLSLPGMWHGNDFNSEAPSAPESTPDKSPES